MGLLDEWIPMIACGWRVNGTQCTLSLSSYHPVSGCLGIELLQADTFDLYCFQSLSVTKKFIVSEPGAQHMERLLKFVYELYADYVLKNPFEMEMPIRCELFDINLTQAVQKDRVTFLGR